MKSIKLLSKFFLSILLIFVVDHSIAGTVTIQYDGSIVDDARIVSAAPGFNGGGDSWGNVTYFTSNNNSMRTYILIPIPLFITPQHSDSITSANLKLYFSGIQSPNFEISAHEILNIWNEYSITWNNKPNHNLTALDTFTLLQDHIWIDFNITELVKNWVNGEKTNNGVVIKYLIESSPIQNLSVLESSDVANSSLRPILEITSSQLPDTLINNSLTSLDDLGSQSFHSLGFKLYQNYPNPFNPVTNIEYAVFKPSNVSITIYNLQGQQLEIIDEGFKTVGNYKIKFYNNNYPSGIYYYKLSSGMFSETKSMLIIK